MMKIKIQYRDENGEDNFFDIQYPCIPRIGEEIDFKVFSNKKSMFNSARVKNVTYYPDKILIYLKN